MINDFTLYIYLPVFHFSGRIKISKIPMEETWTNLLLSL
jgi:hypothetical protein